MGGKMSDIKSFEPKFTEDNQIIPKQKFCASCKKRMECDKLYKKQQENKTTNEYADVLVSMYYTWDEHEAMYIEFPILVNGISSELAFDRDENEQYVGRFCLASVNAVGYDEDVHLGIYLGMMPISIISLYDKKSTTITNRFNPSPAIYIPYFNKVFYGMNMRWDFIDSLDDFDLIKDDNSLYINMAKESMKGNDSNDRH